MFRASVLLDLRFPPIRSGEDVPFGICANAISKNIVFVSNARYFYRNRIGSLSKNTKKDSIIRYDFTGFVFVYDFFKKHDLLDKLTIPTDMIRPSYEIIYYQPQFFYALKDTLLKLEIPEVALKKTPTLKAVLDSANMQEYVKKIMTFREWRKYNFRIKFNKREKIIKLFGKTLYKGGSNVQNKWG